MAANTNTRPKDLRKEYNVDSKSTWTEWLRPLVKKKLIRKFAKIYTPKELQAIREHLGRP